jgi:hypothetical protein
LGDRLLDAVDPDDIAILERAARADAEARERERKDQAAKTAEAVRKMLDGK